MHWAEDTGKIKKSVVDDFDKASKGKDLPEEAPVKKKKAVGAGAAPKKLRPNDEATEKVKNAAEDAEEMPPPKAKAKAPPPRGTMRNMMADAQSGPIGRQRVMGHGAEAATAAGVAALKGAASPKKSLPPWLKKGGKGG